jgi:hypothetical protein
MISMVKYEIDRGPKALYTLASYLSDVQFDHIGADSLLSTFWRTVTPVMTLPVGQFTHRAAEIACAVTIVSPSTRSVCGRHAADHQLGHLA